jgi:predicted site-specific integrase-resolvase
MRLTNPKSITQVPDGNLMYKKDVAEFLGVSLKTVESYCFRGVLPYWKNQVNGRIYVDKDDVIGLLGSRIKQDKEVWAYCRAAKIEGKRDCRTEAEARLADQVDRVTKHCTSANIRLDRIVTDVAIGTTIKDRPGFDDVMDAVLRRKISCLVLDAPDRLARWAGQEVIERVFKWHGVDLHYANTVWTLQEYKDEAKEDLTYVLAEAKRMMGQG